MSLTVKCIFSLAAAALLLVACDDVPMTYAEVRQHKDEVAREADRLLGYTTYVYDKRTKLCLLRSPTTHHNFVYVPVDCTPEVMKLLLNPPE